MHVHNTLNHFFVKGSWEKKLIVIMLSHEAVREQWEVIPVLLNQSEDDLRHV